MEYNFQKYLSTERGQCQTTKMRTAKQHKEMIRTSTAALKSHSCN